MAPHSNTLAWKIPGTEEPGGLQSMGSRRVGHDWATSLSLFTFFHWSRQWQPTPVFLPGESQGRGAWWAAVYGVTQSRTWLKRLSSSRVSLCLAFKEAAKVISKMKVLFTFPKQSVRLSVITTFLLTLGFICHFITAFLVCSACYLTVVQLSFF